MVDSTVAITTCLTQFYVYVYFTMAGDLSCSTHKPLQGGTRNGRQRPTPAVGVRRT